MKYKILNQQSKFSNLIATNVQRFDIKIWNFTRIHPVFSKALHIRSLIICRAIRWVIKFSNAFYAIEVMKLSNFRGMIEYTDYMISQNMAP